MTLAAQPARIRYNGDGVTTLFPIPFDFIKVGATSDLRAVLRDAAGLETVLVENTDYVAFPFTGASTLVMTVAPAVGKVLAIMRLVTIDQEADYVPNDPFPANSHERALDKLTMMGAQFLDVAQRAPRLKDTDGLTGGAFQAGQNRIADLADPVNDTDAATMSWVLGKIAAPSAWNPNLAIAQFNANKLQGYAVANVAPTDNFALTWSTTNNRWEPKAITAIARSYNVKNYGAVLDGVANDAAAFQAAANALPSGAVLYVPDGEMLINAGMAINFAGKKNVSIICDGRIKMGAAVVTGVDVQGGEGVYLQMRFSAGGSVAGDALKVRGVRWGVVDIEGNSVAGNLLNVAGNNADGTSNKFMEIRRVHAYQCGRAILHGDNLFPKYGDAFGTYQTVITNNCVNGNIFRNTNDVVIENFDHFADNTQEIGTDFDTCGSFHFGILQTGGFPAVGVPKLVRMVNCNRFTFQKLYMLSETAGVINGLYIDSSPYVNILDLRALFHNKAIEVVNPASTSLRIENAYCEGNTTDVREFGVNKMLPLVSQYDCGGGTIESAHRYAQTAYKQGWRAPSGRVSYFVQQADNLLVLYGTLNTGATYPVMSTLVDQAAAQPMRFPSGIQLGAFAAGADVPSVGTMVIYDSAGVPHTVMCSA